MKSTLITNILRFLIAVVIINAIDWIISAIIGIIPFSLIPIYKIPATIMEDTITLGLLMIFVQLMMVLAIFNIIRK